MVNIHNIAYTYPENEVPVFSNLSISVAQGEICAILGKNGSGKTTLIKCIAGIIKPQVGKIDVVSSVGYVPQKTNLVYDMQVLDAIVMGRYQHFGAFSVPKKIDYEIARSCAERLGISGILNKNFLQLSGGQQQLVLVARALTIGNSFIVFDEPCAALDFGNQNQILSVIKTLKETNTTAIFSTHDPNHVIHIADKTIILKGNNEYMFGTATEMTTNKILSDLYGMALEKVKIDEKGYAIIARYD